MNITIGVLIPRSDIFPLFQQQLVRGIKLAFEQAGFSAQFIIEDIGKAVVPDIVMGKANSLLMQEVDITFAYVGKKVASSLKDLYKSVKKPLILMGLGVNPGMEEELGEPPYVFCNTLNMWHTCYILGKYAGEKYGKTAIASIGLLEGGYQFLPVFAEGFLKSGGEVAPVHISNKMEDVDFTETLPQMAEQHPTELMVEFYTGIDDDKFFDLYIKSGLSKQIPIFTTSLGVEPFEGSGYPLVHGLCWQPTAAGEVNKNFVNGFSQKHGETPDPYAALTYESALAVTTALRDIEGAVFNNKAFCEKLLNVEFESIRGSFSFDKTTGVNNVFPTIIIDGHKTIETAVTQEEAKVLEAEFESRFLTGWFNPYPCA